MAEPEQRHDFKDQKHEARSEKGEQVLATRHRRCHETLQQLLAPRRHDRESNTPDATAHQIHAAQSGDQEIDVAGSSLGDVGVADTDRLNSPGTHLNRAIDEDARVYRVAPPAIVHITNTVTP